MNKKKSEMIYCVNGILTYVYTSFDFVLLCYNK